jgi:hypothetical protein
LDIPPLVVQVSFFFFFFFHISCRDFSWNVLLFAFIFQESLTSSGFLNNFFLSKSLYFLDPELIIHG